MPIGLLARSGVPMVSCARGEDGNWRPFPLACQTGKRQRRSPSLFGGLGRSLSRKRCWDHLGVNGNHLWISLTPFSTRRDRLASAEGALPRYWGLGWSPSRQRFWEHLGANGTNHLHLITFRPHSWNHMPTLSPSSSHTWQTYLSPRPLFHPNSNWHLSRRCWKNLVYQGRISQISDRYQIWIPSAKSLSVLPFHVFFLTFQNLPVFLLYSLLIVNFSLLRLLCLSSQMISWKPLFPEKLQFSLLWTCPQLLILWTTLHFFIDFSTLSVYLVMLSLGFVNI